MNASLDSQHLSCRNAGSNRARPNLDTSYIAPTDGTEKQRVRIFEKNLDILPVGINDDVFELDGDSITAIYTQHAIKKPFEFNVPMTVLIEYSTAAKLADLIENTTNLQSRV